MDFIKLLRIITIHKINTQDGTGNVRERTRTAKPHLTHVRYNIVKLLKKINVLFYLNLNTRCANINMLKQKFE